MLDSLARFLRWRLKPSGLQARKAPHAGPVWNVAAVALVASGSVGIVAGALIHNVGSVAVVLNAARLVGARLDERCG